MRLFSLIMLGLAMILSGCSSVTEKAESAANRSFTSYAMGRSYADIAKMGSSPLEMLAANQSTYGPMIGATKLDNGMTIYRHMAPAAKSETSSEFGLLVGSSSSSENNRLSYFLVGEDGNVKDWATGSVQGNARDCVHYIGGIINKCSDSKQYLASLKLYDSLVKTSKGQPISVWGQPADPTSSMDAPKKMK
jgi:uncharacterized protein YceK